MVSDFTFCQFFFSNEMRKLMDNMVLATWNEGKKSKTQKSALVSLAEQDEHGRKRDIPIDPQ